MVCEVWLSNLFSIATYLKLITGLKPQQLSLFRAHMCNCWCTQWAELYVRRPTGNFSWMMHLQNEQDLLSMFPEFVLSDISNLFKPMPDGENHSSPNGIITADIQGVYHCHSHCLLVVISFI